MTTIVYAKATNLNKKGRYVCLIEQAAQAKEWLAAKGYVVVREERA